MPAHVPPFLFLIIGVILGLFLAGRVQPRTSFETRVQDVLGVVESGETNSIVPDKAQVNQVPVDQRSLWRFVDYVPSEWETEWVAYAADQNSTNLRHPCERFRSKAGELAKAEQMLRLISESMPGVSAWNLTEWKSGRQPKKSEKLRSIWTKDTSIHPVLSKLIYTVDIGGERTEVAALIEPLAAHLRHPYHCLDAKGLLDTSYPLFDRRLPESDQSFPENEAREHLPPTPFQVFYFDLGATLFPQRFPSREGWGSSQGYFPAIFSQLGLPFDSMSLWEVTKHSPDAIFQHVPNSLLPGYQFFNVPVERRKIGDVLDDWSAITVLQGKLELAERAYLMVRASAGLHGTPSTENTESKGVSGSPETYVVFKLDIDSTIPENGILDRLMELLPGGANASHSSKTTVAVHEFLFEHHTNVLDIVGDIWCPGDCPTLYQSYAMFQALRRRGVRAHSWI